MDNARDVDEPDKTFALIVVIVSHAACAAQLLHEPSSMDGNLAMLIYPNVISGRLWLPGSLHCFMNHVVSIKRIYMV